MRARRLLPALLLLATPAAAQEFRGTISMRMTDPQSGQVIETKLHIGNGVQAMVMNSTTGPLAGSEMRLVINQPAGRITTLVSGPNIPGGKGMKMVSDIPSGDGAAEDPGVTAKPLGTSQTIAGMRCEDYEVTNRNQVMRMCVTTALGRYLLPDMGGSSRGPTSPSWTKAFGNRPAFPLKIWTTDDKMSMEVTGIDRGTPDAALFDENPEGFMTMPGMGAPRRN